MDKFHHLNNHNNSDLESNDKPHSVHFGLGGIVILLALALWAYVSSCPQ